jgi:hypothetical protein
MVRSLVEWVKGRGGEGGKGDGGEMRPYGRDARATGVKGTEIIEIELLDCRWQHWWATEQKRLEHMVLLNPLSRRLRCDHRIVQMYNLVCDYGQKEREKKKKKPCRNSEGRNRKHSTGGLKSAG